MKEVGKLLELNGVSRTRFAPVVVRGKNAECRKEHTNSARARVAKGERDEGDFPRKAKAD